MILIFGPQGSGKGTQAELLAKRLGWQWLSTGNMFRETKDPVIRKVMNSGELVTDELTNRMLEQAFSPIPLSAQIVLDGYPRNLNQVTWLADTLKRRGQKIDYVLLLRVPREEVLARNRKRGREDDGDEAVARRLEIYDHETLPILAYYKDHSVPIVEIDGVGQVEDIYNRIQVAIKQCAQK